MPKIKHNILKWARETSKLSLEDAAHKLGLQDTKKASAKEKLVAYESGEKAPSRSLLLRMSKQYHRPLLTFYLDEPPGIGDRGEDFRTLPGQLEEVENVYVDVLIRDIKARQSTVRETLIDVDEETRLEFIGKNTIEDGVDRVVQTIREALNMSLDDYRKQSSHKEAFSFLRQQVEMAGVFVLLKGNLGSYHSNIAVKAFRGFALSDDIAPFIVINDRDAEAAWSFTLIHEMAHLILGRTGISGIRVEKLIEKFCNDVASEFMLPASEFENRQAVQEKNKQSDGGPSYYVVKRHKLGSLVKLVQRLTYSGALTTTKAGMLLDVRPLKLHRLFQTGQLV